MNDVLQALGNAFRNVLHPRMLMLTVWPTLCALALWIGLAWWQWDSWSQWLGSLITGSNALQWLSQGARAVLAHYSALLMLLMLLAPVILVTAVLIAALAEMPLIVGFVAARHYPALEKRHGGTALGSSVNALVAVLVFAGLWVVTLSLWLTGVLIPVLPPLLGAYLNQRLFRYDALSEHASAAEYKAILAAGAGRMYTLGLLLALLYYVPLVNLLVPVLSGLAFTHFGLARLAEMRGEARGVRSEA